MIATFLSNREEIKISVPDDSIIYESHFPEPEKSDAETVLDSINNPVDSDSLLNLLKNRKSGKVVIVVSDITRPIPYFAFLPQMLELIESAGIEKDEILILVATGMHRVSTYEEYVEMFEKIIADNYNIIDHNSECEKDLIELKNKKSWSGNSITLNRHFVEAGFKITTGLVEPHFMAGFSGGRKAVCPGLSSFETVKNFHGFEFLASKKACNGNLKGNPLHEEALSVAKAAKVDFSVNVILNKNRNVIKAFAGDIDSAHLAACDFVTGCACPTVTEAADVVLTSSGGYPLDASFYQCVKGMVSCLPAIKTGGTIISFGGCSEGIGSSHYSETMSKYEGNWKRFLEDIKGGLFIKDQWQYQMHCRTLEKIGQENLLFITDGLKQDALNNLSVNGSSVNNVQEKVQALVNKFVADGKKIAVFPEGPYCGPVSRTSQYEQLAGVM